MKFLLLKYAQYNLWANTRIVNLLEKINAELLDRELSSSFPSLRKTLFHIWDAELIWLTRLKGESIDYWLSKTYTKETPLNGAIELSSDFADFISTKNENFFTGVCNYRTTEGKEMKQVAAGMVMHCFNHSTFHRGQLIAMLRKVGITELPPTDMIFFLREQPWEL